MVHKGSSFLHLTLSVLFLFCMCELTAAGARSHHRNRQICKRTVKPRQSLDLPKVMGRWYVHKLAFGIITNGTNTTNSKTNVSANITKTLSPLLASCIQSELSFRGNMKNRLEAKLKYLLTTEGGKIQSGSSVLNISIPNISEPAIWTMHTNVTIMNITQRLTTESVIYTTDNTSFSIWYQCTVVQVNGTAIGTTQATVWTRAREVNKTLDSFLDNTVLGLGFMKENLIPIDQSTATCKRVTE